MKRDPLEALMRMRQFAADKARRDLADCLRAEGAAAEAVAAIAASIEHEAEVAADIAAGDAEVEAFAAWLRRTRPQQRAAEIAADEATAATAEARAALAMARAAVRAAEEMQAHHADAARAAAERAAQRELDEIGRRGELIGSSSGQVVEWRSDD
jgi:flagellar export protein FliJ